MKWNKEEIAILVKTKGVTGAAKHLSITNNRVSEILRYYGMSVKELKPKAIACSICGCVERSKYGHCVECDKRRSQEWRDRNKDKVKIASLAYSNSHRNEIKEYRDANKDKNYQTYKRWLENNPDARRIINHNRRARIRKNGGALSRGLVERLFVLQKGKCACCGLPLGENYHIDHILPIALGGANTDANTQLLRQTCNNQKHSKHPVDFMRSKGFLL